MRDLSDRAVREALGMSLREAADFAGVTRNTIALYEGAPNVVREDKRSDCEVFYGVLRDALARLEALNRKGAGHGSAAGAVRSRR